MSPTVAKIIAGLKGQSRESRFDAYPLMDDIALGEPSNIGELLEAVMKERPVGGTFFNDAISYLPLDEFPGLVKSAARALEGSTLNASAESLIAQCSLQCP